MNVCITVDMEQDCPPFLDTYRGVEQGTPRLLALFAEEAIPATFFTTGDVARRFPSVPREIVDAGHELGCHGDTHRRFSDMTRVEADREIRDASATLREFFPVTSFRAPNLDFPVEFVELLESAGYRLDSSQGRHKLGSYFVDPVFDAAVARVPASMSPSVMRLPMVIRKRICNAFTSPAVLFVHPWEFVDMSDEPLRIDNRYRTGVSAVRCLRETIRYFKGKAARFCRMCDLGDVT